MKALKIITGIVFLLLLLQGFAYINLMISEKYEASLMETDIKINSELSEGEKYIRLEEVKERFQEIQKQKRITKTTTLILLVVFIVLCVILIKKPK